MGLFDSKDLKQLKAAAGKLPTPSGMAYKAHRAQGSFFIQQLCSVSLFLENTNSMLGENFLPAPGVGEHMMSTDSFGPYATVSEAMQALSVIADDLTSDAFACVGPGGHPKLGPLGEWL